MNKQTNVSIFLLLHAKSGIRIATNWNGMWMSIPYIEFLR